MKKTATAVHKKREKKIATSFRMSSTSHELLYRLSKELGIERGAVLEIALRALYSGVQEFPNALRACALRAWTERQEEKR